MQVNKNVSGSGWIAFLWYAKQTAAAALPAKSRVQTSPTIWRLRGRPALLPHLPTSATVALCAWGNWREHFSGWDWCSRLRESHSLPPTVNKQTDKMQAVPLLSRRRMGTGEKRRLTLKNTLCARACLYTRMWVCICQNTCGSQCWFVFHPVWDTGYCHCSCMPG